MTSLPTQRILVIKLSALGDVVIAMAPMKRIREAHPDAEITVLTTPPYADFFAASPYVDRVDPGGRPKGLFGGFALARRLSKQRYDRVYDLQTNDRTSALYRLMNPKPQWSGVARGASHPHRNPERDDMHALEAKADQLKDAGIWPEVDVSPGCAPPPDLSWAARRPELAGAPERFCLTLPYALLVPGGSAHRPGKRWPVEHYAALAEALREKGLDVGVIGGPQETPLADQMPAARDLTGQTGFLEIAALGAQAAVVVGNDTGPTHILAAAGAPTLCLFSADSDPKLSAPRGARVEVLRQEQLTDLSLADVVSAAESLLGRA
ncbi:MAG TPA: glycosyltransferase family 9 protein [Caulobacteraceae bacterium]|jgi:ADP-heptose:LPS heptosyltransferase|nr:glycosyltransferase family 9 protein [Caulobacteraceae bacterium]